MKNILIQTICRTFLLCLSVLLGSVVGPAYGNSANTPANAGEDWRETYAYVVGMQAVIYGYPVVKNMVTRYGMVEKPVGRIDTPLNTWFHVRVPGDATDKLHSSITENLLYSAAWFDVSEDPLVVTVPDAGNRYYGLQMMEMYSDIFAYVGLRATGNKAGNYLIVGPGWEGEAPDGIAGVLQSLTPTGMLLLRIVFTDRGELAPVHKLQDQSMLTPLSYWVEDKPFVADDRDVIDPAPASAPLAFFANMNKAMTENPPPAKDQALIAMMKSVGLGSRQPTDFDQLDAETRAGLKRAITDGLALLDQVSKSGGNAKIVNNWAYGQMNWGRTATTDDFLTRSANQSYSGMQEHHVEEVVKLRAHSDAQGEVFDGSKAKYVLHFPAGNLPEAKAFWSVTVYNNEYDLADNPIDRYSLGSQDSGLVYEPDGSLRLLLQAEPPAEKWVPNWLPIPIAPFNLFLRTYIPGRSMIDQTWTPPPVERVSD
jgi:hypothetical protein